MTIITQDQALQRWDTLPSSLREALCSEKNTDFLLKSCAGENVLEPKTYEVARIAGYVLLGFLHPEDVAQELVEALKIDSKTAKSIQDALSGRIFTPLRVDIDRVYAPLSNHVMLSALAASQKIIHDINVAPANPASLPKVESSQTVSPPSVLKIIPAEPAPMMLHEDTTFKPAQKNEGFTLSKPSAEVEMHAGVPQAPSRPAVLEFGGLKVPTPKPPTPTAESGRYGDFKTSFSSAPSVSTGQRNISQVVPAAPAPVVPKPPMLTSVMTPASTVPVPPRPPQAMAQIPQPPKPPAMAQADKPIVKDFL